MHSWGHAAAGLILLVVGQVTMGGCSRQGLSDDFPPYPPAERFLAYERHLHEPRRPDPREYGTYLRHLHAFREVEARKSVAQALRAEEQRRLRQAELVHWRKVEDQWRRLTAEWMRRRARAQAIRTVRLENEKRRQEALDARYAEFLRQQIDNGARPR